MTTITERVAAGAAFLDEHDPEWWRADVERAIDLDQLDMAVGDSCVLGQRCPVSRLAAHLGIDPDGLEGDDFDVAYEAMALHLGAPVDRAGGTRVDNWAAPLGFQAALTPSDIRSPDDYDALAAEWKRVITERRSAS
jgi:hypothetical protein